MFTAKLSTTFDHSPLAYSSFSRSPACLLLPFKQHRLRKFSVWLISQVSVCSLNAIILIGLTRLIHSRINLLVLESMDTHTHLVMDDRHDVELRSGWGSACSRSLVSVSYFQLLGYLPLLQLSSIGDRRVHWSIPPLAFSPVPLSHYSGNVCDLVWLDGYTGE